MKQKNKTHSSLSVSGTSWICWDSPGKCLHIDIHNIKLGQHPVDWALHIAPLVLTNIAHLPVGVHVQTTDSSGQEQVEDRDRAQTYSRPFLSGFLQITLRVKLL